VHPSMAGRDELRVVVVGAGLAGLACASDLAAAGATVRVLEAGDAVGGRMRTDRQAGFLLDRGFQVFNTSYPQVKRRMDLRALQLRAFTPGMLLHTSRGRVRFTDPTRRPRQIGDILTGRLAGPRDLAALTLLTTRDMFGPVSRIRHGREQSTLAALRRSGVSSDLIDEMFRPFLAGVFLEDELETSSRFFHLVWRSMLRGTLCLPRRGIQAVPEQLAAALPPGTIRLETPVSQLTGEGVLLGDGSERPAHTVVVATGAAVAARLLPGLGVPMTRTVTTLYHAAPVSPLTEPTILVDTEREILNTSVLTEVTPGYATDGRALISTSVLGTGDTSVLDTRVEGSGSLEAAVRGRLAIMYQTDTTGWEHLASYTVEGALPAMAAPYPLIRGSRVGPGRYVCGDHRATGSVQGALASGARAAREVLAAASASRSSSVR
jgi:phytoene dehydrogenase-like protein